MNQNIIKRVLEEISKPEPRIDYIRGMLETVIEMTRDFVEKETKPSLQGIGQIHSSIPSATSKDESSVLAADGIAKLNRIKAMGLDKPQEA